MKAAARRALLIKTPVEAPRFWKDAAKGCAGAGWHTRGSPDTLDHPMPQAKIRTVAQFVPGTAAA